jgi:hypothetical protein
VTKKRRHTVFQTKMPRLGSGAKIGDLVRTAAWSEMERIDPEVGHE